MLPSVEFSTVVLCRAVLILVGAAVLNVSFSFVVKFKVEITCVVVDTPRDVLLVWAEHLAEKLEKATTERIVQRLGKSLLSLRA